MKELSEEFKKELEKADVPEGQVGIAYLTPTDKDNFTEEKIGEDLFKVTMDSSFIIAKIKKDDSGVGITIDKESNIESDYYSAKLIGYVMFKIVIRY